jgi:hypothetical protein
MAFVFNRKRYVFVWGITRMQYQQRFVFRYSGIACVKPCLNLLVGLVFRNTVELELKQECTQQLGVRKYVGPLTVALQELDGTFKHILQIEGTHSKADIVCHSKSRRQKKKKIPLCTGEEVDMDLSAME